MQYLKSSAWRPALTAIIAAACVSTADAQLRIVTYNIAELRGDDAAVQDVFAALADDPTADGLIRIPDVYIFQEMNSGITTLVRTYLNNNAPLGVQYTLATFTVNGGGGENALYYRSDTLAEDASGHRDILNHAGPRATDRWKLQRLDAPLESFYIYGSHFKADTGVQDQADRESEANAIRNDADSLGEGVHIIYAGDYNVYSASEGAFQRMLQAGAGQARDIGFGGAFTILSHTQSPYDGSLGSELVGGGMDDRFDFLLVTDEFNDGSGYTYMPGTYRSFGNDGQHFNEPINDGFNSYFDTDEQWKADALARASDHLPVVADFFVPGNPFRLTVDNLVAGENAQLTAEGAGPNQTVYFIYSLSGLGETFVPQLNVTLRLANPALGVQKRANGAGVALASVPVPGSLAGQDLWLQAAIPGEATDVIFRVVE